MLASPHGNQIEPQRSSTMVGTSGHEGQGPFFEVSLHISRGRIETVSWRSMGCVWSTFVGIAVGAHLERRTFIEAERFSETDLRAALPGLPLGRFELVSLAMSAVTQARAGWKRSLLPAESQDLSA